MRRLPALLMLALILILLAGCRGGEEEQQPAQITVQLKWFHGAQFAGFYLAAQQGFYARENLEVTLLPGGPQVSETEIVASGAADFGVANSARVLLARAAGLPLVALAAVYQMDPFVYISLKDSGIQRPQDFVGRKVAVAAEDLHYVALLKKLGIERRHIQEVPYTSDLTGFFSGEVEVQPAYLTDQVLAAREQGYEVNVILPSDYSVAMYSDIVFTTERMVAENPEVVERFLRATLRGWREAIQEPVAAVEATLKYDPGLDPAHQLRSMEASIPLVFTGEREIGGMESSVWEGTQSLLLEQGLLEQPLNLEEAFTTEFLEKIYDTH
jgi:NitT/TauT family transport system substrate-binding protein